MHPFVMSLSLPNVRKLLVNLSNGAARSTPRGVALGVLLAGVLASPACSQGEGDYCQVNADCSGDLVCVAGRNQCQKAGTIFVDAAPVFIDAAPLPDSSPEPADASVDLDADLDASTTDAGAADAS